MAGKRTSDEARSQRVFGHPSKQASTNLRVGLYARVSTQDQQTIPMQTRALREYRTRRGWTIALQVKEIGSGASQRERREQLLGKRHVAARSTWCGCGGWIAGAGPQALSRGHE